MDLSKFRKGEDPSSPVAPPVSSTLDETVARAQDMADKRRALLNLSFSTLSDRNLDSLLQSSSLLTTKQASAYPVVGYLLSKYELEDLRAVLLEILSYRRNTASTLTTLLKYKQFASLFDLFKNGAMLKKDA